jgi:hypothetical protein
VSATALSSADGASASVSSCCCSSCSDISVVSFVGSYHDGLPGGS